MKYLIVFILCSLATAKVCIQAAFTKNTIINTADVLMFNALSFLSAAVLFSYTIADCPPVVWIYALVGAVSSVVFQLTYTKALSLGNVSLTVLIINMALVINILVSYLFYGDSISGARFVGILFTLLALALNVDVGGNQKSGQEKKWLLLTFFAMLSSAAGNIVMKILGESTYYMHNRTYVSAMYIIASFLAFGTYLLVGKNGKKRSFKINKKVLVCSVSIGVCLSVYMSLNSYALSVIEGTFLFPAISGGCVVFAAIAGVVLFKEKLSRKQLMSIISGAVAVIMMNF